MGYLVQVRFEQFFSDDGGRVLPANDCKKSLTDELSLSNSQSISSSPTDHS